MENRSQILIGAIALVLLLVPMGASQAKFTESLGTARPAKALVPAAAERSIVLNEVMPKADGDGAEWIELYAQPIYKIFLPLVIRSNGSSSTAGAMMRAASPTALSSLDVSGWEITDEDGNVYTIPDALPPVPYGAFVLITFDGQGSEADDYDFSDGVAELHTPSGLTGVFEDTADQVALYDDSTHSAETIRDFAAWGAEPGDQDDNAVAADLWSTGYYLEFAASAGFVAERDAELQLFPDESLGRHPTDTTTWVVFRENELTPGNENPVPQPSFYAPPEGSAVDANDVTIAWDVIPNATSYRFQLAETSNFTSPLVDTNTQYPDYHHAEALSPGTYYWRVRVNDTSGEASPWTAPTAFQAVDLAPSGGLSAQDAQAEKTLGITWQVQHKDTYLLDVSEEGNNTKTGDGAWDKPHPDDHRVVEHDNHYCQVASMSMINSYYGGDISQDRLSYYAIREYPESKRGLDPDRTCTHPDACRPDLKDDFWAGRNKGLEAKSWMLGYAYDDNSDIDFHSYNPPTTTIPFNDIKSWIDANRPLMVIKPGHVMVIDGYRTSPISQVHLLDPWSAASWKPYTDTGSIQKINWVAVYPAPGTPPAPRSDESSIWTDSDGDGVYDFDEVRRFHTDPFEVDSDGDWVPDKKDILETVYDRVGNHVYTPNRADWDGDGNRKELDWDNDGDTAPDGCEDTDYDGELDYVGETDNFDIGDYQPCKPQLDILHPLKVDPISAGAPSNPDKILVQVSTAVPDGWPLSLTRHDFGVDIGDTAATVLSVYPSGDSHWLVVQPPAKSSAYYDLSVSLTDAGSDSEINAVYYLTNTAKSEVVVLDRSGSMGYDDKMEAAQNAGSAFVDFLNDGDEIGVASFGYTGTVQYGLTEITDSSVRDSAIMAIDALTPTGWTALGQGAYVGYNELSSQATSDNEWSLVLLSDGHENESPYWDDVSSSITDAIVHTVALGEDADSGLLQRIASEKHGRFFAVDVAPPYATSSSASSSLATDAVAAPPLEVAQTLPNRMADTYVAIGELEHRKQRLWDRIGSAAEPQTFTFTVEIEKALPEAIFTLNWDDPLGYLTMALEDPSGSPTTPDGELRSDTHHQLRVTNPDPGTWTVEVETLKAATEYHFMLSGKSTTTLIGAVGGDPQHHTIGKPIPIYGILSDNDPITGADVYALVAGPAAVTTDEPGALAPSSWITTVQLYDDGAHGDRQADDGLYANEVIAHAAGGYSVKLVAEGTNNDGETFRRYAHAGFNVRHRVAYVWDDNVDTTLDYAALFEDNGWAVDTVQLSDVPDTDFSPYSLIVIGPDTGYQYDFDDPAAADALAQWDKPFLGLGDGGAAIFNEFDLYLGYGQTWISDNNNVYPVAPATSYWNEPYPIYANIEFLIQLYPEPLTELGVHIPDSMKTVTSIAREEKDVDHYPVAKEIRGTQEFILWGYNAGPSEMTEEGWKLMVNLSHSLR